MVLAPASCSFFVIQGCHSGCREPLRVRNSPALLAAVQDPVALSVSLAVTLPHLGG